MPNKQQNRAWKESGPTAQLQYLISNPQHINKEFHGGYISPIYLVTGKEHSISRGIYYKFRSS